MPRNIPEAETQNLQGTADISDSAAISGKMPREAPEVIDWIRKHKGEGPAPSEDILLRLSAQEFIGHMRDLHKAMMPGTPLREKMVADLQERLEARGEKDAEALARQKIHKNFADLEEAVKELELEAKNSKPRESLRDFLKRHRGARKCVENAIDAFRFMVKERLVPILAFYAGLSAKAAQKVSAVIPQAPSKVIMSSSSYNVVSRTEKHRELVPTHPILSTEDAGKVKEGTGEIIAKANEVITAGRVQEKKEIQKTIEKLIIDEKEKKMLAQAVHDALVEFSRLIRKSGVHFNPAVQHFFTKADLQALLAELRYQNARATAGIQTPLTEKKG